MQSRPGPLAYLIFLGWLAFAVREELARVPPAPPPDWISTAVAVAVAAGLSLAAVHVLAAVLRAVGSIAGPLGAAGGVVVGAAYGSDHGFAAGMGVGLVVGAGSALSILFGGWLGRVVGNHLWRTSAPTRRPGGPQSTARSRMPAPSAPRPVENLRFNPRTGEWE